jgi:hydrogenase-4 component H
MLAVFSPAYTTKFPGEPFEPQESFRGRPRYDAEGCIGCGACAQVCPPKCIDVIDDVESDPPRRILVQHFDSCIMCGQCERYCPTQKGIRMTTEWDNAGFKPEDFEDRIEKELQLCEVCGEVLAPCDQLQWLADRLGPISFANPTLSMYSGRHLGYVEEGVKSTENYALRQDRMAIQCPKCRRQSAWAA